MSKIALTPNASGTGVFTIASPNSNTDRVITLPDEAGTVLTDTGLPAELNATGSAPIYACRAWVNFNGTGTVAIRASGNVSSITDIGTGKYNVNFTTSMPDANYSSVATSGDTASAAHATSPYATGAKSTTQVSVGVYNTLITDFQDTSQISVSIFR